MYLARRLGMGFAHCPCLGFRGQRDQDGFATEDIRFIELLRMSAADIMSRSVRRGNKHLQQQHRLSAVAPWCGACVQSCLGPFPFPWLGADDEPPSMRPPISYLMTRRMPSMTSSGGAGVSRGPRMRAGPGAELPSTYFRLQHQRRGDRFRGIISTSNLHPPS
jgi:hypothetical protein